MSFAARKKLYPGNSGYSQNTGGSLKNLRSSTSNEKVRKYHEEFYRPENLVINVIGHIDPEEIFEVLMEVEQKILDKRSENPATKYERPWQKEIEKFGTEEEITVEFSSDDNSTGSVSVAWRLDENIANDYENFEVYNLLMKYLAVTDVSPLEEAFVESKDAISTSVTYRTLEYEEPTVSFSFSNVPVERKENHCFFQSQSGSF